MAEILAALGKSVGNLAIGRIWLRLIGPAAVALGVWLLIAFLALDWLSGQLLATPPLSWLSAWGAIWLAQALAWLGGWLVVFALAYLSATLLAAIFVVPLLVDEIAPRQYPALMRLGEDSFVAATGNSVFAALGFIAGWLVTLPLWLIPGMGLLLPVFWLAWLNRRTFAYDALAAHASKAEWQSIFARHRGRLLVLGMLLAVLAHLPLLGLFVPTFAALAYIHYGLAALAEQRRNGIELGAAAAATGSES